jgi:hypothetical protein
LISRAWVLPSRLILFDLTFSLVPVPLFLLASVANNLERFEFELDQGIPTKQVLCAGYVSLECLVHI